MPMTPWSLVTKTVSLPHGSLRSLCLSVDTELEHSFGLGMGEHYSPWGLVMVSDNFSFLVSDQRINSAPSQSLIKE